MITPRVLLLLAACLAGARIAPDTATAQAAHSVPHVPNRCLDSIPASVMRPVTVFLSPNLVGASKPRFELHDRVDPFAETVARTVRTLLASTGGSLPAAEPMVTWRSLEADVHVVAHRDGTISWRVQPDEAPSEARLDDAGARLVGRAIDTIVAHGQRMTFPQGGGPDSVEWLLQLKSSFHGEDGAVTPPKMRAGFPIFSVLMPPHRSPSSDRVRVRYPETLRRQGFMGEIVMLFTVDTTGRVIPSSIRDQRPPEHSPLDERKQTAYDRFVRSTREALARASYHPARIGGCVVTATVRQPFTFTLDGGVNGP